MSRLVMLSDATGVRGYAVVIPVRMVAQTHLGGYGACKDGPEWANTVQTRHLRALWRITTATPLVAKEDGLRRLRLGDGRHCSCLPRRAHSRSRPGADPDAVRTTCPTWRLAGPGGH